MRVLGAAILLLLLRPPDQDELSKQKVWEAYRKSERALRRKEHESNEIRIGDKRMRIAKFVIGDKPKSGYPLYIALHGGGGGPARMNDAQWEDMKTYYRRSVKAGVYVAPRGMTNTWNLHFVPESFPAYDRIIENMILFEDVDPDRVYILGFSAGGDGTYSVAARMAGRWAAANMSAGHPNGLSMKNLYNTPMQLQVGERDRAYNRHMVTAEWGVRLDALRKAHPGGYVHATNVHVAKPHNFYDNDPRRRPQKVVGDPAAWHKNGGRGGGTEERDTNAITWLDRHTRDPHPDKIVWEPAVGAPKRSADRIRYWLELSDEALKAYKKDDLIIARLDRRKNTVIVEGCKTPITILLTEGMLDLSKKVKVKIGGKSLSVKVKTSKKNLERTVRDRGDPRYMFEGAITLEKKGTRWSAR
jgi:hypothetical protein